MALQDAVTPAKAKEVTLHIKLTHVHVAVALLGTITGIFAFNFFCRHIDACGHGLDITCPLLVERVMALCRLAD